MAISLLTYLATFSGQFYFWRSYFFILPPSNYFDTTVTISKQLLLQSCYFFEELPFPEQSPLGSSYFFRIATFSKENFYQAATS